MELKERIAEKATKAGLTLLPPATANLIEEFEARANLRLADDHRHFLLHAANGGREPCRLLPLERWADSYWLDEPITSMVAAPCTLFPEIEREGEHWLGALDVPDWESRWDRGEWSPMLGTMAVAEIGCGLYFSMIMNGRYRGRIFAWGDHASHPPQFLPHASFGEWLESNLDLVIADRPVHFLNGRL